MDFVCGYDNQEVSGRFSCNWQLNPQLSFRLEKTTCHIWTFQCIIDIIKLQHKTAIKNKGEE